MTGRPDPNSARQRKHRAILSLLALNPARTYSPAQVGRALGMDTHQAATALYGLAQAGRVARPARGTYQHQEESA